jgi:SNF2 family DNA or RNA helicase
VAQDELAQKKAEGIGRRGQILAMLLKLEQICDHPAWERVIFRC